MAGAWCLCLAFDRISNFAFIGDYSGGIHMVRLEEGEEFKFVTTLKGHAGLFICLGYHVKSFFKFRYNVCYYPPISSYSSPFPCFIIE